MIKMWNRMRDQRGFTLLELLVVVAILAVIAGALMVAYDGLQSKAAKGAASYNIAAVDQGVRTFKVVSGSYPNSLDSMLSSSDGTSGNGDAAIGSLTTGLKSRVGKAKLGDGVGGVLTDADAEAAAVASLSNVGITSLRYLSEATASPDCSSASAQTAVNIPNRIFDAATTGCGAAATLAADSYISVVESSCIADFSGSTPATSATLTDITGLAVGSCHLVAALGLGNNSTIVSDLIGTNAANFSEAPAYNDVDKTEYGRYVLLFLIGTDSADADTTFGSSEILTNARFVGVLDANGGWMDESLAEFSGQKS